MTFNPASCSLTLASAGPGLAGYDESSKVLDNTNTVLGLVYSPSTDVSSGTVPMSLYTRVIPADSPLTLVYPGFAFVSLSLASEEPYPSYAD